MGRGGERSPCIAFAGRFREGIGSGCGETAQGRGVTLGPPPRWHRVSYLRVTARVSSEILFPGVFSLHHSLAGSGRGKKCFGADALFAARFRFSESFCRSAEDPAGRGGLGFAGGGGG